MAVVTSPGRYADVLAAVEAGGFTGRERASLAAEAFAHTATYDVHVASWMGNVLTDTSGGSGFPAWVGATWDKIADLRYGDNPHQKSALYGNFGDYFSKLHGKDLSATATVIGTGGVFAHGRDPQRILRALEVFAATGRPIP